VRVPRLLHDLVVARGDGSYTRLLAKLAKTALLVLDDWGLAPLTHSARTHLSLDKDAPEPRLVEHPDQGGIVEKPMVGGLHHRYTRQAA
jgi:IstB-like ATP binding protein